MEIDFIGESYTARSPAVDCQETINMYPEITEAATQNSKAKLVLMRCPGLKKFGPFIPPTPPPPPPPTAVANFEIVDDYSTKWPSATIFSGGNLQVNDLSISATSWLYELFAIVYKGILGIVSSYAGENNVVDDVGGNTGDWSHYDNNGYLLDFLGTPKYYERGLEEYCFELDGLNSSPYSMLRLPYYFDCFYFSQTGKFEIKFDFNVFKAENDGDYYWPGIFFVLGNPFMGNLQILVSPAFATDPSINDVISVYNAGDTQEHHVPISRKTWHSLRVTYDNGRVEVYLDTNKITPDEYKDGLLVGVGGDFVVHGGNLDSIALIDDIIISRGAPEFVKIAEYTTENPTIPDETVVNELYHKLKLTINGDPELFLESDPFKQSPTS